METKKTPEQLLIRWFDRNYEYHERCERNSTLIKNKVFEAFHTGNRVALYKAKTAFKRFLKQKAKR